MNRGGDGKLKGKRSRRPSRARKPRQWWRLIWGTPRRNPYAGLKVMGGDWPYRVVQIPGRNP